MQLICFEFNIQELPHIGLSTEKKSFKWISFQPMTDCICMSSTDRILQQTLTGSQTGKEKDKDSSCKAQ